MVQHGLFARSRLFTVSVLLPDKPGQLVDVATLLAKENANVIRLDHNQFYSINRNDLVELRITVEAEGPEHKREIVEMLEKGGYRPKIVQPKGTYLG